MIAIVFKRGVAGPLKFNQGCGTGKFEDGSGSDIFSEYGSGYGSGSATLVLIEIKVPSPACKGWLLFINNLLSQTASRFAAS